MLSDRKGSSFPFSTNVVLVDGGGEGNKSVMNGSVRIDLFSFSSGVVDLPGTCWMSFHAASWFSRLAVSGSWQKLAVVG